MTVQRTSAGSIATAILNVDDSEAARDIKTHILSTAGYRVIEAATGAEALRLVREAKPQLVLLGVKLPDLDGVEVCRSLKGDSATASIIVVLISALAVRREDPINGLEEGADGYLVEPVEPAELLTTVRGLLRLYHSEQRLQLALRATNDVVWEWDAVNDGEMWNQAGAELFGWTDILEEPQPSTWWIERIHPDDRQRIADTFYAVLDESTTTHWQDEYRFRKADGEYAWVIDRGYIIRNDEGRLIRMIGAMQDVSDRVRHDASLRASEERLQRSMESLALAQRASVSGVWDWNMTTGDIYVSPEYRRLFGFLDDEPVTFDRWLAAVHEDDRPAMEEAGRRLFESGADWNVEFRIVHPERGLRWLSGIGQLERDEAGRPQRFSGVNFDITDRKQTERRSRLLATETLAATAKFRAVFDQSAIFAGIMNLDGTILEANRSCLEVCGYRAEEVLGRPFWETPWWRGSQDARAELHEATMQAAHGAVYRKELPYWWADGTERLMDFTLHSILDDQGQAIFLYPTGIDITESKRRESNLVFLANVQEVFSSLSSADEIMRAVSERIVGYLRLSRCLLVEIDERARQAQVFYDYDETHRSSLVGSYPIDEFFLEDGQRQLSAGRTLAIADVRRVKDGADRLAALGVGAIANAPYVSHDQRTFVLSAIHDMPHQWRADEVELLTELASRVYVRLERARAEEALRVSEQEFRSLAEAVPQLVWAARPDGWNIYFNQQWMDYTGLTLEEGYGYSWSALFHPDDEQRAWDAWQRATQRHEPYELECRLRRADGVYRWWLIRGVPIFNANGDIQKWFGTCTDIEDLKQGEQALQENAKRLRLALEAGQMGAWDVDLRTRTISWDDKAYALLGFEAGSVEPSLQRFYRCVHPDDLGEVKRLVDRALETGRLEHEFRVIHPDGQVRWLAARGHVFHDDRGLPVRIVGVNFDVTDRRYIEEQLRSFAGQLERLVDERTQELVRSQTRLRVLAKELNLAEQRERKRLAGELHDYLAQLLVLGCLKLGQVRRLGLPPKAEETVKETEEVLNQALNYSRTLMAELSPPVLQEHGLPAGLKWLGEHMQRNGLMVRVEVSDEANVSVPNDCAVLLFQSVRELLMNALKHAGCQQVHIRLQEIERRLYIEVCDDGVGFDLAAAAATNSTAMSSKLGLFSIRERMIALGGWMDLHSAPGEGTRASLVLPLAEEGVRDKRSEGSEGMREWASGSPRDASDSHASHVIRVLLVDDHAMVRQGLRTVLDSYTDIEVVGEAWNGEEAVTGTDRLRPAVVVMDINMPKMSGIEATRVIKERHPDIVVIGLSVQIGGENERAMKQAGGALLLTKEAAVDELYRVIQKALTTKV